MPNITSDAFSYVFVAPGAIVSWNVTGAGFPWPLRRNEASKSAASVADGFVIQIVV
jgi:hypothetical protein